MMELPTFCISFSEDEEAMSDAEDAGRFLDVRDFNVNGYPVDVKTFPKVGKVCVKGKGRARDDDEDREGEGDARSGAGGGGSSCRLCIAADSNPSESASQSSEQFIATASHEVVIQRRPGSAPATSLSPAVAKPREKRRKVASAGGGSPRATGRSVETFQTSASSEFLELKKLYDLKALENETLKKQSADQEKKMTDLSAQFAVFMAQVENRLASTSGGVGGSGSLETSSLMRPPAPHVRVQSPARTSQPLTPSVPESPPVDDVAPPSSG